MSRQPGSVLPPAGTVGDIRPDSPGLDVQKLRTLRADDRRSVAQIVKEKNEKPRPREALEERRTRAGIEADQPGLPVRTIIR